MKVSVENYRDDTIPADDLKVGQIGLGKEGGSYYLKIHGDVIVSLNNPGKTWSHGASFRVTPLPPGTKIVLEAEV